MSELIQIHSNDQLVRSHYLATASVLVLTICLSSANATMAEEEDSRPVVWIEVEGQLDTLQGTSNRFDAPFMHPDTVPAAYGKKTFAERQTPTDYVIGEEGKITLQPKGSDWVFAASVRYGRGHGERHRHYQSPPNQISLGYPYTGVFGRINDEAFSDSRVNYSEHHLVLDFQVGRDVGLGIIGSRGTSAIGAGVRYAQFKAESSTQIFARPTIYGNGKKGLKYVDYFNSYILAGSQSRSFTGIGPSLNWSGSTALLGDSDDGEVTLDWGIQAALLFGRQKTKTSHETSTYHKGKYGPSTIYPARNYHSTRSRSVTVPNLSAFAGISVRYTNAKLSLGYRGDFFFGATDTGIDARDAATLGFHGPFATVSIGLGG